LTSLQKRVLARFQKQYKLSGKFHLPKSTLLHLRFHFSFFLLPVFLFAVSQSTVINTPNTLLAFFILHFLVFPSSNGYNSYHDKDTGSIGLLKNPPPVSKSLLYCTNAMDIIAIVAGLIISPWFSILIAGFIGMSRAYSNRRIRLKRYPIIAFIIVAFFQGGYVYIMTLFATLGLYNLEPIFTSSNLRAILISSLFVGSIYPLTQIYQHTTDKNDGVITLSYRLGYIGSFVFSMALFLFASVLMYIHFSIMQNINSFFLFSIIMLPVFVYFLFWIFKVKTNKKYAAYEYSMLMNVITSLCMNAFFLILIMG